MQTRTLLVAAVLLVLAGAAAHYAWAAVAKPLDEPMTLTKGQWIRALCVLGSRSLSFDGETATLVATYKVLKTSDLPQHPGQPPRTPERAQEMIARSNANNEAYASESAARLLPLIREIFPTARSRVVAGD